jgi:putative membrane protein
MWDTMPGHGGVMAFGGLFGLLFWILLIIAAVALLKWLFSRQNNHSREWSAMDILNQRFASGDITEEEYLRMKKRIEEGGPSEL